MDQISNEDKEKQTDDYIRIGKEFEKINKHQDAIKNYKKALDALENIKSDKSFKLNMKLGELYRNNGDMDSCLKYFNISYEIALKLDNIYFKIDSLNKLAMENFFKGEINTSLTYINKSSDLLKEADYAEGQLNNLIYWISKYYYENEYYKAREVGNKALKLCGDEFPYYRGRILNQLATLFTGILNANEHIQLLNEALISFEKINYIPGILGVTNNIGVIYADKLLDNDKALEYYSKLRKKAKQENFDEFLSYSYMNTGEINLRSLRYVKAYLSYKKGLEESEKAKLDHMRFFTYSGLINSCMELEKYNEGYKYFKLANQEFLKNPEQGPTIPEYHKAISFFNYRVGDIEEAKKAIKQSLNSLGNHESVINWNTGLLYELIRLRGARNNSEANEAIEGIRGLLSKYKNSEIIMDNIYNSVIELINKGYNEDAIKLMDKYKDIKVKPSLKRLYIEAYINDANNEENLDDLNKLKILAEKIGGSFKWRIDYLIGDFNYKRRSYDTAAKYYSKALKETNKLIDSVPEEYRDGYSKTYNLKKPKNKLESLGRLL